MVLRLIKSEMRTEKDITESNLLIGLAIFSPARLITASHSGNSPFFFKSLWKNLRCVFQ